MKMKKKILSAAIVASMGMGSAHAVNLSQDGTGEVAIVPYYSVQSTSDTANWETLISVVNTTGDTKALKVRFREAMNSYEVYDFNLYLSPYDVWTGKVQQDVDGSAQIITNDESCTVPDLVDSNNNFVTYAIPASEGATADRLKEGYIEVFEMAVINDPTMQTNILHVNGVPGNCSAVVNAFGDDNWLNNIVVADSEPTGGLKVSAALINVQDGTEIGMPVTHLAAFRNDELHVSTGTLSPTLGNALPPTSVSLINADAVGQAPIGYVEDWVLGSADAVSALLMTQSVMNEYTVNPAVAATTDWVVTFPTKWDYVNRAVAKAPFTTSWSGTTLMACEPTTTSYWDREEATITSGILPSPQPADARLSLCWEANVINMGSGSDVLGSKNVDVTMDVQFNNGWIDMQFVEIGHVLANDVTHNNLGLPAIGFRATRLGNANVGVGAAYAVGDEHAYYRVMTVNADGSGGQALPKAGDLDTTLDFGVAAPSGM